MTTLPPLVDLLDLLDLAADLSRADVHAPRIEHRVGAPVDDHPVLRCQNREVGHGAVQKLEAVARFREVSFDFLHLRFGLPARPPKSAAALIKRADRAAAYLESVQLAGFSSAEGHRFFGRPRGLDDLRLEAWPPTDAKERFLSRFAELTKSL